MPRQPLTSAQEAAIASLPRTLQGHYTIVYSCDDEANYGKGWYVDRWWSKGSPSFRTRAQAVAWAAKHECVHEHPQA
jgi:hypothetical protein